MKQKAHLKLEHNLNTSLYMKSLMTLFLSLSLALGPLSNVWGGNSNANSMTQVTAEQALLNAVRERVSFSLQANLTRAQALKGCFAKKNTTNPEVCAELVGFIRQTTAFEYPRMRQYQFMINLLSASNFRTLQADFSEQLVNLGNKNTAQKKIEQSPMLMGLQDDPLEDIITRNLARKKDIQNSPFSAVEIQSFLRNDINYKFSMARLKDVQGEPIKYPMNFDGHLQMLCDYVLFGQHADGCRSLHLAYNAKTEMFNFTVDKNLSVEPNTMAQKLSALDLGIYQLAAERDDLTRRYFALVQLYPFVALAPAAVLSDADIEKIADVIVSSAQGALDEFREFLVKTEAKTAGGEKTNASREEWLNLLEYNPIVEDVLAHPSEEMNILRDSDASINFQEILTGSNGEKNKTVTPGLIAEHAKDVTYRNGKRMGLLIAANIAVCGFPWERGVAFAVKAFKIGETLMAAGRLKNGLKSMKLLCFPVTNFAVNFGYSWLDVINYGQTYNEVFGYFERQSDSSLPASERTHFLREVQDLDSQRRGILYSFIMAFALTKGPVADIFNGATSAGFAAAFDGAKWLGQHGIRLSKPALSYLQQAIERARSLPVVSEPPQG